MKRHYENETTIPKDKATHNDTKILNDKSNSQSACRWDDPMKKFSEVQTLLFIHSYCINSHFVLEGKRKDCKEIKAPSTSESLQHSTRSSMGRNKSIQRL
jgi:hypothetical protein